MGEMSYDAVEAQTEALLEEWGAYQRTTRSPQAAGYPPTSVEGKLMRDSGSDRKTNRYRQWAWRRNPPKAKTGGKTHRLQLMASEQTESSSGPRSEYQWPAYIVDTDRVIAGMPAKIRQALIRYYIQKHSLRSAAQMEGVPRTEMDRRVDRGRFWIASRIQDAAS